MKSDSNEKIIAVLVLAPTVGFVVLLLYFLIADGPGMFFFALFIGGFFLLCWLVALGMVNILGKAERVLDYQYRKTFATPPPLPMTPPPRREGTRD